MVEGRLSPAEFSDRAELAYASKTAGELQQCLRDLPRDRAALSAARTAERRRWLRRRLSHFAMPNIVCVGAWALTTGGHGYFWPAWIFFITGVRLTRKLLRGPRYTE